MSGLKSLSLSKFKFHARISFHWHQNEFSFDMVQTYPLMENKENLLINNLELYQYQTFNEEKGNFENTISDDYAHTGNDKKSEENIVKDTQLILSDILHFNETQVNPDYEYDQYESANLTKYNKDTRYTEWIDINEELEKFLAESENSNDITWTTTNLPERTILCNEYCEKYFQNTLNTNINDENEQIYFLKWDPTISNYNDNFNNKINEFAYKQPSNYMSEAHNYQNSFHNTTPEKPAENEENSIFNCPFYGCVKYYAKASHLKMHVRRHTGEKPFSCTWPNCSWKFSRSDELARHRRSHSGVKPYKCTDCNKSFSRSDHLAKHKKIHRKKNSQNKQYRVHNLNHRNI